MKKTEKEWRKIVQLAHYARLSINPEQVSPEAEELGETIKKEHGLSETDLQKELKKFKEEVLPKKETIIRQKATEIIRDIEAGLKKLQKGESLSTNGDNREIYHRMQEILAIDPKIAGQALKEEEAKANISHTIIHRTNLNGDDLGGHTYYFSFDK